METFSIRKKSHKNGNPLPISVINRLLKIGFKDNGNTYEIPLKVLTRNELPIAV